ncbi:MAG TPA: L-asparaginase 2 [Candidatus Aminicenantes bacterium]|nr:L-asparaginase 2 [Candidatus Aminicenantes bacterium]
MKLRRKPPRFSVLQGLVFLSLISVLLPLWLSGIVEDAAETKPHIVLLSMGGTIAAKSDNRMNLTNYGGGRSIPVEPGEWLDALPEMSLIARVTAEDCRAPREVGGGMTLSHWLRVARRLQELARDKSVDGIAVTHGTNLMAETAWFMNLVVDVEKPVVFVGSQRPWNAISGDGPLNLYNAVRVAASASAARMGILHVMNDTIHSARDVTKASAYRIEAFKSPDLGPLGLADSDRIVFYRAPLRRHTYCSEFRIDDLSEPLPKVEILYSYTEAPGYLVDKLVEEGAKGIVIDGSGAGDLDGGLSEAIKKAREKGVIVVATTRTRGGRVQDTILRREAGILPGDNLPP